VYVVAIFGGQGQALLEKRKGEDQESQPQNDEEEYEEYGAVGPPPHLRVRACAAKSHAKPLSLLLYVIYGRDVHESKNRFMRISHNKPDTVICTAALVEHLSTIRHKL
jgi:hypothetical protein